MVESVVQPSGVLRCGPVSVPLTERFWQHVHISPSGCWPWRGATSGGYGRIRVGSLTDDTRHLEITSRVAWELVHGSIPEGLYVLHRCDNPPCVRPAHLFLGTIEDNNRDRVAKGHTKSDRVVALRSRGTTRTVHGPAPLPVEVRFWRHVEQTSTCWLWRGARTHAGHGQLRVGSLTDDSYRIEAAHRLSWTFHYGSIPDEKCVLHKCDNPPCVNPSHLFLGTQLDNIADMNAKARGKAPPAQHGEANNRAKITEGIVREIRAHAASGESSRRIASLFGLRQAHVRRIVTHVIWSHVR